MGSVQNYEQVTEYNRQLKFFEYNNQDQHANQTKKKIEILK